MEVSLKSTINLLSILLDQEETTQPSDFVQLICKNGVLRVHKMLLLEHSPLLREVLGEDTSLTLPDFDISVVENLVGLLYKGRSTATGGSGSVDSIRNLVHLLGLPEIFIEDEVTSRSQVLIEDQPEGQGSSSGGQVQDDVMETENEAQDEDMEGIVNEGFISGDEDEVDEDRVIVLPPPIEIAVDETIQVQAISKPIPEKKNSDEEDDDDADSTTVECDNSDKEDDHTRKRQRSKYENSCNREFVLGSELSESDDESDLSDSGSDWDSPEVSTRTTQLSLKRAKHGHSIGTRSGVIGSVPTPTTRLTLSFGGDQNSENTVAISISCYFCSTYFSDEEALVEHISSPLNQCGLDLKNYSNDSIPQRHCGTCQNTFKELTHWGFLKHVDACSRKPVRDENSTTKDNHDDSGLSGSGPESDTDSISTATGEAFNLAGFQIPVLLKSKQARKLRDEAKEENNRSLFFNNEGAIVESVSMMDTVMPVRKPGPASKTGRKSLSGNCQDSTRPEPQVEANSEAVPVQVPVIPDSDKQTPQIHSGLPSHLPRKHATHFRALHHCTVCKETFKEIHRASFCLWKHGYQRCGICLALIILDKEHCQETIQFEDLDRFNGNFRKHCVDVEQIFTLPGEEEESIVCQHCDVVTPFADIWNHVDEHVRFYAAVSGRVVGGEQSGLGLHEDQAHITNVNPESGDKDSDTANVISCAPQGEEETPVNLQNGGDSILQQLGLELELPENQANITNTNPESGDNDTTNVISPGPSPSSAAPTRYEGTPINLQNGEDSVLQQLGLGLTENQSRSNITITNGILESGDNDNDTTTVISPGPSAIPKKEEKSPIKPQNRPRSDRANNIRARIALEFANRRIVADIEKKEPPETTEADLSAMFTKSRVGNANIFMCKECDMTYADPDQAALHICGI